MRRAAWPLVWLLPGLFALSGCAPAMLAAFDAVQEFRQASVVLLLDGKATEADRYARYGYTRKAERLQRHDARLSDIVEATRGEFVFCPLSVQWQEQGGIPPEAYRMRIVQQPMTIGDRQRQQYVLQIRDPQGDPLPGAFPDEEIIGESLSEGGLRMAFRGLNQRLVALEKRAIKTRERAALRGGG